MIINRSTIRDVCLSAVFLVLAGWMLMMDGKVSHVRLSVLSFILFCSVCIACIISIQNDLVYAISRNYLSVTWLLLLFWLCLEFWMTDLNFSTNTSMRVLWYLTYIPALGVANTLLLFSVTQGVRKKEDIPKKWYATIGISVLFLIGILTNDLHERAFVFIDGHIGYHFGPWYYCLMAWVFIQLFVCTVILYRKAKIIQVRRRFWRIWLILFAAVFYYVFWVTRKADTGNTVLRVFNLPQMGIILTMIGFEVGIRTDLIRSNYNYREFFTASDLSAIIADSSGPRIVTKNVKVTVTEEDMKRAREKEYRLDQDHFLCAEQIRGGWVYWIRDISPVNRIQEQLEENRNKLEQENTLIDAENTMNARAAKADEQNLLYTMMARSVEKQLAHIEQLITGLRPDQPDFQEKMSEACVYKAYVKRYCNLRLLAREQEELSVFELKNSISESGIYLSLHGVRTEFTLEGDGSFRASLLLWAFSVYEMCVEADLSSLEVLEVNLWTQGAFLYMEITARGSGLEERAGEIAEAGEKAASVQDRFSVEEEKDVLKISLSGWKENAV